MNNLLQRVVMGVEAFVEKAAIAVRGRRMVHADSEVVLYNGFGTPETVWLQGRVLQSPNVRDEPEQSTFRNLAHMLRRYRSDEVRDARVMLEGMGRKVEVLTDEEGYYSTTLEPVEWNTDALWQPITATFPGLLEPVWFEGMVQIPTRARFGVISDVDDTVVRTGATNLFNHMRVVLMNSAYSRVPFAGVAPFYRALQEEGGDVINPFFYISSSPWNLYTLFSDFLAVHDIPAGTFFLKDFGFDENKFLKAGHRTHKRQHIEQVLHTYPELPFLLIGDSGQKDAEIYRDIIDAYPERILAVYLRDVSKDARDAEVRQIAEHIETEHKLPFMLVPDTMTAARHAADHGWIKRAALPEIDTQAKRDHQAGATGEDLGDLPEQLQDQR